MNLSQQIEAILFFKAEPVGIKKLSELLEVDQPSIITGLENLSIMLKDRGITLLQTSDEVTLGTHGDLSRLIEKISKEELNRDLGKSALETLSIILYQGPITRSDIDYIRGVNSQFIIRNLLIRGLIERIDNPKDYRSFLYRITLDLLSNLGISKVEDLPEYENVRQDIESFKLDRVSQGDQNLREEIPNVTES